VEKPELVPIYPGPVVVACAMFETHRLGLEVFLQSLAGANQLANVVARCPGAVLLGPGRAETWGLNVAVGQRWGEHLDVFTAVGVNVVGPTGWDKRLPKTSHGLFASDGADGQLASGCLSSIAWCFTAIGQAGCVIALARALQGPALVLPGQPRAALWQGLIEQRVAVARQQLCEESRWARPVARPPPARTRWPWLPDLSAKAPPAGAGNPPAALAAAVGGRDGPSRPLRAAS